VSDGEPSIGIMHLPENVSSTLTFAPVTFETNQSVARLW